MYNYDIESICTTNALIGGRQVFYTTSMSRTVHPNTHIRHCKTLAHTLAAKESSRNCISVKSPQNHASFYTTSTPAAVFQSLTPDPRDPDTAHDNVALP